MNVKLAYKGHSALLNGGPRQVLSLSPNLAREPVAFDAPLLNPLRFREAISALHDVVISDLRFKKRDKTAYLQWKQNEAARLGAMRKQELKRATEEVMARRDIPVAPDLVKQYHNARKRYWDARQKYNSYLMKHDMALWRLMMPCDPVITVAEDVCFFECFSGDESS